MSVGGGGWGERARYPTQTHATALSSGGEAGSGNAETRRGGIFHWRTCQRNAMRGAMKRETSIERVGERERSQPIETQPVGVTCLFFLRAAY